MKDAAKIGEGHFLQAHRPRKTRRNDGRQTKWDGHRMWIVAIPSIHGTADFYRARLKKILDGRSVLRYSSVSLQMGTSWTKSDVRKERIDFRL